MAAEEQSIAYYYRKEFKLDGTKKTVNLALAKSASINPLSYNTKIKFNLVCKDLNFNEEKEFSFPIIMLKNSSEYFIFIDYSTLFIRCVHYKL